jgi:quercetin dioxygenase-like cupin family protein
MAILEGDPSKAGAPFAIRAKLPDGYRVPPHWHPTDERIVVLQGTFGMGLGERFDPAAGRELPVGSYVVAPKGVRHFVWAKGETVIQVSGMGPIEINYVNPADDPRKASKK